MGLISAWRLVSRNRASTAFDGEGSYRYGNRWNGAGTRVVYLAASTSLAALEILVHADNYDQLPEYRVFRVDFDESMVMNLADLPPDWTSSPAPASTRNLGSAWAASNQSLVLRVPSAVVTWEYNYMLNVLHPDFPRLEIDDPRPFTFDPRPLK